MKLYQSTYIFNLLVETFFNDLSAMIEMFCHLIKQGNTKRKKKCDKAKDCLIVRVPKCVSQRWKKDNRFSKNRFIHEQGSRKEHTLFFGPVDRLHFMWCRSNLTFKWSFFFLTEKKFWQNRDNKVIHYHQPVDWAGKQSPVTLACRCCTSNNSWVRLSDCQNWVFILLQIWKNNVGNA